MICHQDKLFTRSRIHSLVWKIRTASVNPERKEFRPPDCLIDTIDPNTPMSISNPFHVVIPFWPVFVFAWNPTGPKCPVFFQGVTLESAFLLGNCAANPRQKNINRGTALDNKPIPYAHSFSFFF